jgi:hypothetical protein
MAVDTLYKKTEYIPLRTALRVEKRVLSLDKVFRFYYFGIAGESGYILDEDFKAAFPVLGLDNDLYTVIFGYRYKI